MQAGPAIPDTEVRIVMDQFTVWWVFEMTEVTLKVTLYVELHVAFVEARPSVAGAHRTSNQIDPRITAPTTMSAPSATNASGQVNPSRTFSGFGSGCVTSRPPVVGSFR